MAPEPASGQVDHGISMWGAPGSGKTTLLAALSIALTRRNDDWKIIGADPASTDYLIEKTDELSRGRVFPEASRLLERYRWMLIGHPETPNDDRGNRKAGPVPETRIGINMSDAPGGLFAPGRRGSDGGPADLRQRELLDNLSEGRGIVFLFDPIREFEVGDAYDHLHAPLTRLAERMLSAGQLTQGRLPHFIAVCITKFDDPRVLQTAQEENILTFDPDDPYEFPRVTSEDAPVLFRQLCKVSATGDADLVLNSLGKFFHADRIRFFVTSSIGFYLDRRTNLFDWHDYVNLLPEDAGNGLRIRGQVRPINVVEPMLWLGQRLAGEPGGQGR